MIFTRATRAPIHKIVCSWFFAKKNFGTSDLRGECYMHTAQSEAKDDPVLN